MYPGRRVPGLLVTLALLAGLLGPRPSVVAAHPLDEYLQATYVTLAPTGLKLELDLTPGLLVAPELTALIDADRDGAISEAEGQAYAHAALSEVLLEVDGQRYPLTVTKVELPPMLNLTSGVGTIRLGAAAVGSDGASIPLGPGAHQAFVENRHAPVKSTYQVTVVLERAAEIEVAQQRRDELQQSLRVDYSVVPLAQPKPRPRQAPRSRRPAALPSSRAG